MTYKACILAAGRSKIGADHLVNPAVLPIGKQAVISYIIEKFPKDVEIVIAVGYKKETITEYLKLAHPERTFTYVHVPKFEGPGTGPGTSLLACKDQLQSPFVLFTADTILLEEVPAPTHDWVGVAHVEETEPYATVKIENESVTDWVDKKSTNYSHAYIGTAGIHSYEQFWNALEKKTVRAGEVQITDGIIPMMEKGKLKAKFFTWFDTGSEKNLRKTFHHFSRDHFDFGKFDEFIYFVNDRVVKFYEKQDIVQKKIHRATTTLKNVTPEIIGHTNNFFAYKMAEGTTLYPVMNDTVCQELMNWLHKEVWKPTQLEKQEQQTFKEAMRDFYHTKTMSRLAMFYDTTGIVDKEVSVNGEQVPPLAELFKKIDWEKLYDGLPGTFHGDCNFGNLVMTSGHKFYVIDWRQEMGGLVDYGDVYYDLAKLYGGMTIHFERIKEGRFSYTENEKGISFDFDISQSIVSAKKIFCELTETYKYDLEKIKTLAAITFLNMSPLHHEPYNRLLYYFGRLLLHRQT